MSDYEYIFKQAKLFYYKGWPEDELRKCVDMLPDLSQQELVSLSTCRWIARGKTLRQEIFRILFMDKLGKREERLKELSTNELINEFEDKNSGNISLIREELKHRYKEDMGDDRIKIAAVFRKGTKGDQQWLELQQRRELSTT